MLKEEAINEFENSLPSAEFLMNGSSLKRVEILFELFWDAYNKAVVESEINHQHLSKMMNNIILNNRI